MINTLSLALSTRSATICTCQLAYAQCRKPINGLICQCICERQEYAKYGVFSIAFNQ